MFVADSRIGSLLPGRTAWLATTGLGDYAADEAEWTRLWRRLHGLAQAIAQATGDVTRWSAQGMIPEARARVEDVRRLRDLFAATLDEMRPIQERLGAGDLSGAERALLGVGTWIEQSVRALPGAIAALPKAVLAGVTEAVTPALLWIGLLGLGLILLVGRAERTRTYRRFVA
jgi:hypothetical protein